MQKDIIILGAGGHAAVVIEIARLCGYRPVAVFDDREESRGKMIAGVEVKGRIAELAAEMTGNACIAIGNNEVRKSIAGRLAAFEWPVLIHPAASVSPQARIGMGTVICAGAVIQPNASVGSHVIVNIGACVDHDSMIGDFGHLAGRTYVGAAAEVGAAVMVPAGTVIQAFSSWPVKNVG